MLRSIERIYRRRIQPHRLVSLELGTYMCGVSHESGRQIGVLVNRRGRPEHVFVGDARSVRLPDFGRLRVGRERLRGLRLVHTHLREEGLDRDDLTDLALLRLDCSVAISAMDDGRPLRAYYAHLLPLPGGEATTSVAEPMPFDRVEQFDFLGLVNALEEEFSRKSVGRSATDGSERAILVNVFTRQYKGSPEVMVAELKELCRTAGIQPLESIVQHRLAPDPRYLLGRGKLEDAVIRANQLGASMLIFGSELAPAQARAITDATELKVVDRSMLILDIFAQHADTQEGKLQVELAQLRYTLPRLVEKNTMMSRLTGGIGGRGPGETKLEINRRRARERIARLEKQLHEVAKQRERRRAKRLQQRLPVVSIIGYTNAGKSTLLNTLTSSDALVADKMFATLNPLSRRLRFPRERELIVTDTVGFLRDLPDELIEAFRATLEELSAADLLIHLVDASDTQREEQISAVVSILHQLEFDTKPRLLVFNKVDLVNHESEESAPAVPIEGAPIAISAKNAETLRPLLVEMERRLWQSGVEPKGATSPGDVYREGVGPLGWNL